MNIFHTVLTELQTTLQSLQSDGVIAGDATFDRITVEPPRDASHGDMATNAAMVLAKSIQMPPREFADIIAEKLQTLPMIESCQIAGPGFINMRLSNQTWASVVPAILQAGTSYGDCDLGGGTKINVEYVSANPTGPLHIGHARGSVFGDCLANLLHKVGYTVTKEYYINDAGNQVKILARTTYLRYLEAHGETIEIPEGLYPGEYLKEVGEILKNEFGDKYIGAEESDYLDIFRERTVAIMMDKIKTTLSRLGIVHDVYYSENELVRSGKVDDAYNQLVSKGLIYEGTLEAPKGKLTDEWESRPQMLFKATEFGDDEDRALKKSDGSWTYFANDIAYHYKKSKTDNCPLLIDILGADHAGYVKRMKAATKALADNQDILDIKTCQIVKLMDNGEPLKMSKRSGTFVTLDDLIDAVGSDVVRFFMMTRKPEAQMEFDLTKVKEESRDNPIFYIHYAYARCNSALRQVAEKMPHMNTDRASLKAADVTLLDSDAELALLKQLAEYPRLIASAGAGNEPHRVAYYLDELVTAFHSLWGKGKDDPDLRFVREDNDALTQARSAMVEAVKITIASALSIFGIEPRQHLK